MEFRIEADRFYRRGLQAKARLAEAMKPAPLDESVNERPQRERARADAQRELDECIRGLEGVSQKVIEDRNHLERKLHAIRQERPSSADNQEAERDMLAAERAARGGIDELGNLYNQIGSWIRELNSSPRTGQLIDRPAGLYSSGANRQSRSSDFSGLERIEEAVGIARQERLEGRLGDSGEDNHLVRLIKGLSGEHYRVHEDERQRQEQMRERERWEREMESAAQQYYYTKKRRDTPPVWYEAKSIKQVTMDPFWGTNYDDCK